MGNETNASVDYTTVLADLKARRAQLDAAIAAIEQLQGLPPSAQGAVGTPLPPAPSDEDVRDDSFFGLSIPDATRKFLTMRKRSMSTQEIAEALQSGGLATMNPENFANTVGSVLRRLDREDGGVVKLGLAKWGLTEWYPGRNKRGKKQIEEEESEDKKS